MKKSIYGTIICVVLICMVVASLSFPAFAATDANITDYVYHLSYIEAGTWSILPEQSKTDTSRVYVAPERAPTGYTRARVLCNVGGSLKNVTTASAGYVVLTEGKRYAISNTAYQTGDYTAGEGVLTRLSVTPDKGAGILEGLWSPDWSGWTDNGKVELV